jgi:DNA-directed RNA polymerase specialized sigma24 family protein
LGGLLLTSIKHKHKQKGANKMYAQYHLPKIDEVKKLTHAEARFLHKQGEYNKIIESFSRLAIWMAIRYTKQWHWKIDAEELMSIALLKTVELTHQWNPRKQTLRSYMILGIRDSLWEECNGWQRYKQQTQSGISGSKKVICDKGYFGEGCLNEVEANIDVLSQEDQSLLCCRYGLMDNEKHDRKELSKILGVPIHTIDYRLRRAAQRLHNHLYPEDRVDYREASHRMAGKIARRKTKQTKTPSQSRGAINARNYRARKKANDD